MATRKAAQTKKKKAKPKTKKAKVEVKPVDGFWVFMNDSYGDTTPDGPLTEEEACAEMRRQIVLGSGLDDITVIQGKKVNFAVRLA